VDATRIYLASIATGADIRWNDTGVETYRNFANKIWNATRFCLMNAGGAVVDPKIIELDALSLERQTNQALGTPTLADWWIEARLAKTSTAVNTALETYQFHEAVRLIYHFFWHDFCDWYIELTKDTLTGTMTNSLEGRSTDFAQSKARSRILTVLEQSLRLLHPFMPFLTEELWQQLPGTGSHLHKPSYSGADQTIMLTDYPNGDVQTWDAAERVMNYVIELISKVRNIRAEMSIRSSDTVSIHVSTKNDELRMSLLDNEAQILKLARADNLIVGESLGVPRASAKAVLTGGAEVAVPLEGLIDFDKERARLNNHIAKLDEERFRLDAQLANANFVARAPAEKVVALRERSAELAEQVGTLGKNLEALA